MDILWDFIVSVTGGLAADLLGFLIGSLSRRVMRWAHRLRRDKKGK